jgi:hypothetical protein
MQFKVKGILSYPHLFAPRAIEQGQDPKYSTTVLILKTDPQVAQIQAIIEQEKANGWPSGFPANGKVCLKDCAVAFPENPAIHGYMAITGTAKADSKPAVVDMNMQPVLDPSQVYAGSICWVAFNSFTYDTTMNKGVSAGLNAVMVTGEESPLGRLDGKPSVESLFADVAGGATAPATTAPVPAAAAPTPPVPPAVPEVPAPAPQYVMTAKANGATYQQMIDAGWTNEMLVQQGMAIAPSFA